MRIFRRKPKPETTPVYNRSEELAQTFINSVRERDPQEVALAILLMLTEKRDYVRDVELNTLAELYWAIEACKSLPRETP